MRPIRPVRLIKSLGKKLLFLATTLVVIGGPILYLTLINANKTQAAWFDDNWAYRKAVNIATHTAAENNVYINLTGTNDIDTSDTGRFQTDCGDLRFTDAGGKLLQYYIVSGCGSADTVVHVFFQTMPAGAQTVYYYYGNPTVTNGGNGADFATEASSYTFTTIGSEEKSPGPLVYFKFDDGTGTTTQDATTNNIDGTLSGPTWQTEDQCISGKCLWFDGSNDYVYAADNAILDNASSALTVGAWIKPNSYDASNWDIIATKWKDGAPASYSWHFSLHQGKLSIFISSDGTSAGSELAVDSSVIETNKWSYVVFTVDTATDEVKLYKNGVQVGSTGSYTAASIPNSSAQLRIGTKEGAGEGSFPFPGFIDDVKIYPYARSAAQIKSDYDSRGSVKGASTNLSSSSLTGESINNGLVGYWKMDQSLWNGTASEVIDSSGNGNHGTAANSATTGTGKFGNGGVFGSSNKYVNGGGGSTTNLSSGVFTLSAWIYPTTTQTGYSFIYSKEATNSYGFGFDTNGYPYLAINDGSWTEYPAQSSNLSINTWHHFVATRSSDNTLKFYIDGVQAANTYSGVKVPQSSSANLGIGGKVAGTFSFSGTIDEARIYNRALSPADVTALYNFAPGPVGYWNMDENQGTSANDKSGNGNTGTWTGTGSHWTPGKYGSSGKFNASDDDVTVSSPSNLDITNGTIEAWINIRWADSFTAANPFVAGVRTTGSTRYSIHIGSSTVCTTASTQCIGLYNGTTYVAVDLGSPMSKNVWHHIAITVSGGTMYVYVDGLLKGSAAQTIGSTTGIPFHIGGSPWNTNEYFNGYVDDVRIYSYPRSAKQIVEDMNAGHPAVGSPVGSAVGHWKFDEGADNTCSGGTNDTCNSGSGGSTHDGAKTGATWTNSGKFGKALSFDGTDDDVNVGDPSNGAFDFGLSDSFTLTAWIKTSGPTGISDAQCIICKDVGSLQKSWWFRTSNTNVLQFLLSDGTNEPGVSGSTTVTTGQWIHVAAVRDVTSDTLRVYINGNQDGSTTDTTTSGTENANSVKIGEFNSGATRQFNGTIDEPKIYRYALTADEVKIDMNRSSSQVLGSISDKTGTGYEGGRQAANQEYCVPGDSTSCAAPIAEWKLNEKQGITAYDTSGNGYNGTLTSTSTPLPSWIQGKSGSALSFDGTTNYVTTATIGNFGSGLGSGATLEFWINTTTTVTTRQIGVLNTGSATAFVVDFNRDKTLAAAVGKTDFYIRDDSNLALNGEISTNIYDGKWHHVAWVISNPSSNSFKVYVDGAEQTVSYQSQQTPTTFSNFGFPFIIGAVNNRGTPASFINAKFDQVKIFNYGRSGAQVAWDYNRGAPVGHWKFDECQGTTAYDDSRNANGTTNGNNGTITVGGAPNTAVGTCTGSANTMWKDGATGKYNSSLDFDGTDDGVNLGDVSQLEFKSTDAFTVSAWVKANTISANSQIIGKMGGSTAFQGWVFWLNSSGQPSIILRNDNATNNYIALNGTNDVDNNAWRHVSFSYDGSKTAAGVKIYVDGVLQSTTVTTDGLTGEMQNTSANASIGYRDSTSNVYFPGQIDDVQIYNYALTATQVKTLYNQGGAARFGPSTGSP